MGWRSLAKSLPACRSAKKQAATEVAACPVPRGWTDCGGRGSGYRQCAEEVSATRLGLGASHTARAASEKDTAAIMKM